MKKIYLVLFLIVAVATSCKKPTTVVVVNNGTFFDGYGGLNGTLYDATLLLYNGSDIVGQENLGDLSYGGAKSNTVEVEDYVEKVRLMFKFYPNTTTYSNPYKYTSQFYMLSSNEKNEIIITGETLISNYKKSGNPIKKELTLINPELNAH